MLTRLHIPERLTVPRLHADTVGVAVRNAIRKLLLPKANDDAVKFVPLCVGAVSLEPEFISLKKEVICSVLHHLRIQELQLTSSVHLP